MKVSGWMVLTALATASLMPSFASGTTVRLISGLVGGQDDESKQLLALPPDEADHEARRALLSVLTSRATFSKDNSRNVEGAVFYTDPYETMQRFLCRKDRVALSYQYERKFTAAGVYVDSRRRPVGVEIQHLYHSEELPIPSFQQPSFSNKVTICDTRHPDAKAAWFGAPGDIDAARGINLFRMAEDQVKAGKLTPGPCDQSEHQTCSQWVAFLDDASKIQSVTPCPSNGGDDACYVISFGDVELTIAGTIPSNNSEPIAPTAVTSIRADYVMIVSV